MCVWAVEALAIADRVAEEPQPPLGADPRVQLADAAGGHVPRVGEERLALGLLPLVEPHEIAVGHVDFAPRFEDAGILLAAEPQGDVVDRADVVGHVVAHAAVPAGDPRDQQAVFIDQRHGHAVDLQLDDPLDRLAGQAAWRSARRSSSAHRGYRCFRSRASARDARPAAVR